MKIKKFTGSSPLVSDLTKRLLDNRATDMGELFKTVEESKKVGPSIKLTEKRIEHLRQKISSLQYDAVTDEELAWLECDRERAITTMEQPLGSLSRVVTVSIFHGTRARRIVHATSPTYSEVGRRLFQVQPLISAPIVIYDKVGEDVIETLIDEPESNNNEGG